MTPYARFSRLNSLNLTALERRISQAGSSPYVSDLYAKLLQAAQDATEDLADAIGYPLMPWQGERRVWCPEPRRMLPLEAYLIKLDSISYIHTSTDDGGYIETLLAEAQYQFNACQSLVHWYSSQIEGYFDVTGLWGQMSPQVITPSQIGTTYTVPAGALAGATSLVLSLEVVCKGGEVFYDPTNSQALIASSSSGTTVQLDQWGTPETAIAAAGELVFCGRLDRNIERFVLLGAFLNAWRQVTEAPERSGLLEEKADRHSYKRGDYPSEVVSAESEWQTLKTRIMGRMKPWRWQ